MNSVEVCPSMSRATLNHPVTSRGPCRAELTADEASPLQLASDPFIAARTTSYTRRTSRTAQSPPRRSSHAAAARPSCSSPHAASWLWSPIQRV